MSDLVLQDTKNQAWKDDKSRFGFKMLQKMGWKEDKGLGKNDSGSVASIKVSKREEGLGLGMEKVTDGAGVLGWNSTAKSFDEVLKLLNESYGKPKKQKKVKSKIPILTAGMKYKKHSSAKDLTNKSAEELKSIFGHSVVMPSSRTEEESGSTSTESQADSTEEKKSKKSKRKSEDKKSLIVEEEERATKPKKNKKETEIEEEVEETETKKVKKKKRE